MQKDHRSVPCFGTKGGFIPRSRGQLVVAPVLF